MVKIVADPGSCHLGNLDYAKRLLRTAKDVGADAVKWQLFRNKLPNVELPTSFLAPLFDEAKTLGIETFASVFDFESMLALFQALKDRGLPLTCKLAYSVVKGDMRLCEKAVQLFDTIYMSGDVNTAFPVAPEKKVVKLFCIPEYPVKYQVDFDGLFAVRFDGFSSHCLGTMQDVNAVKFGAQYIEKHIRLDIPECDSVPDGRFALRPEEFEKMVVAIKEMKPYAK